MARRSRPSARRCDLVRSASGSSRRRSASADGAAAGDAAGAESWMARDVFDPYALLEALERRRVTYIVVGALGRVLHGSDELTDGVDVVPSLREENLRRLALALDDLNARRQ